MNFVKRMIDRTAQPQPDTGPRDLQPRAQRYPIAAPVRFRHVGHLGWRSGRTMNLSRSGVLFESEAALAAGTVVDLAISLPTHADGQTGKTMIASAIVVRQLTPENAPGKLALAARIVNYSM